MRSIIRTPLCRFNEWRQLWRQESRSPKMLFFFLFFSLWLSRSAFLGNHPHVNLHLRMFSATIYTLQLRTATSSNPRIDAAFVSPGSAEQTYFLIINAFHIGFSRRRQQWSEAVLSRCLSSRLSSSCERDIWEHLGWNSPDLAQMCTWTQWKHDSLMAGWGKSFSHNWRSNIRRLYANCTYCVDRLCC